MFITFEGIDGSGKSTQARSIAGWLYKEAAHGTLLTHEPGGWDGGQVLRNMVLTEGLRHRWSEPYLFMLDRAEHVARVIQPALDSGKIVLCERYHDSTLAYQSWEEESLPMSLTLFLWLHLFQSRISQFCSMSQLMWRLHVLQEEARRIILKKRA